MRAFSPGRGTKILLALLGALVVFLLLFDWDWLRGPLNRTISEKTQRRFDSSHLAVQLGWNPVIRLKDVYFANADWADGTGDHPMARIGTLEFSVSLRDLWNGKVFVPRVAMDQAELNFEKAKDERRNWVLGEPSETKEPSKLLISSLSVRQGKLRYVDRTTPFDIGVDVETFDPAAAAKADDAKARPDNARYTTRYRFAGTYHDAKFSGQAQTGDVLSFQGSDVPFPIQGRLVAGTTRLDVEGTVADAANISGIDVRLNIAGNTLANLYPFLLLPLPASPPYRLSGHLKLDGNRYSMQDIQGRIGKTDVAGEAAYVQREPRPLLTTTLHSKLLNLPDLGPLVGLTTKETADARPLTQAETQTRERAQAREKQTSGERALPTGTVQGERLLPTGKFEGGRFKAIDAKADLRVDRIDAPDFIALQNLRVKLDLKDAVLRLDPFDVDLADGEIRSVVRLDAQQPTLRADVDITARRLKLARLVPPSPRLAPSSGAMGARAKLSASGNSIADLAAKADGQVQAALSRGQVSNLLDAVSGLNGGKILTLLMGGDKPIPINCGAVSFDVKDGQGKSQLFVIDTEDTRIEGDGGFDLDHERFDLTIAPKPKKAGILSLRTPVRVYGSFRSPDFELDKAGLALRGGGAVALALVNPLAALLPLIETGPGEDTDCQRLLASAGPAAKAAAPTTRSRP
ncbi:membrane protein [Pseudorhodoferax aquiterrae]|uniref:Membrane protein n=1 Tax=Pseudorhodoferax aquiterrae TaxID=747304 RepID=A0ABQ3G441_9BURK|nr:AsmA family protein [Pseudorhodoferax aquiterrae]GHC88752.1 membrane protein [Pseudorhodoferax aquiterrae]